jgi:hypothetical protein
MGMASAPSMNIRSTWLMVRVMRCLLIS